MIQVTLFDTQTFLEKIQLDAFALYYVEQSLVGQPPNSTWNTIMDNFTVALENSHAQFADLTNHNQIIQPNSVKKEEFKQFFETLYQKYPLPVFCFLGDVSEIDETAQEGMLKVLEEPPSNLHFILYCKSFQTVKKTILSRSKQVALPQALIVRLLDNDLLAKVKKKLPDYKQATNEMLKSNTSFFRSIDLKKVEREELSLWLWQINLFLRVAAEENKLSWQWFTQSVTSVAAAYQLNNQLVQKKFVVERLCLPN